MAKKAKEARGGIDLQCTECKEFNYHTSKNRNNTKDKLELNKYCPRCHKATTHKEKK